jgi:hypothetical protein
LIAVLIMASDMCQADITTCTNVYVGRIWVTQGVTGIYGVVVINSPSDGGGSYWVYFSNWTAEDKKAALAVLTAAKLTQHRVNVATTNSDKCGISAGATIATSVCLATNP